MIEIKAPSTSDAVAISGLLHTLGYPGTQAFMERRILQLLSHPDEALLVAADNGKVVGVISLHFIPQLALSDDFCRISYLCVAQDTRSQGIGALLEAHAVKLAQQRGCDRIEVHCHARRTDAHRFYNRQAYVESPKYFFKSLVDL